MFRSVRLFVLTSLLVLAIAPLPSSAQTGLATVTGIVTDNSGAAVPGVTVTATNQATNVDYTGVSNEAGVYIITGVPIGSYVVKVELHGLQGRAVERVAVGRRRRPASTSSSRSAPSRNGSRWSATGAVLQTENAVVGQTLRARAGREAADPGPQPVDRDALHGRRHHAESGVVQQPEEHRRRPALRQRPARAGQQLHARRRRHERRHRQPDRLPAEPGRGGAGQRRDQQLLARARQRRRRDRQHGDQVGHQPLQRQRLLLLARQRPGGDAVGDQPRRRPQGGVQRARSSAARSAGRSRRTSCSSSPTTRAGARSRRRPTRSRRSSPTRGATAI